VFVVSVEVGFTNASDFLFTLKLVKWMNRYLRLLFVVVYGTVAKRTRPS